MLMPSRSWRIAYATMLIAVLFPPSRFILRLILGICLLVAGPARRQSGVGKAMSVNYGMTSPECSRTRDSSEANPSTISIYQTARKVKQDPRSTMPEGLAIDCGTRLWRARQ